MIADIKFKYNRLINLKMMKQKTLLFFKKCRSILLFVLILSASNSLSAAVGITVPSLNISTPVFPSAYSVLGDIIIDEGLTSDFPCAAKNTDYTFTISAPSNFEFLAGTGTITGAVGDITLVSLVVTSTTITVTYRSNENQRTDEDDILTISGIQVRAITGAAVQTATKTASGETIAGLGNGTVVANLSSVLVPSCTHTIRLTDTFGDGWNGGTVTVTVNGTPVLTNIALAGMTGPEDFTFAAATGDVINVTRTADGTYPTEMRVEIIGGAANTILTTQLPVVAPGTDVLGCCAPSIPGLATYSSPANGAIGLQNCGTTLTWTAPTNSGCNAVVSYDVYFGTSATPPLITNTTNLTYSTGGLAVSTTYYWKIVPKNATGDAVGSATWSFTTSATAAVPGLATYTSPANGGSGQNVCGVAMAWNPPTITGCNAASSYDVYFGTSATPPFVTNTASTVYNSGTLAVSTTYYWKIVPRNAQGAASGAVTWSFSTGAAPCAACTHTIRLTDTFGDGWNGGTITVSVNGVPVLTNIALAGMTGPEDFTFSAADGDVINVTRTNDGTYPAEMRVQILGSGGTVLLPIQQPVVAPGTNVSGCCTPIAPSCATNPSPANSATGINPCSVDFSWTAPVSSSCNAPTSYDLYFGTSATPPFLVNVTGTNYAIPSALADNTVYYWKIVPRNASGASVGCPTWSFTTGTSSNPAYCLYGSAINYPSAGTNCAQLTSASSTQNGCAWNRGQISFASAFDYSVQMYFGAAAGGADGCAFVFQNSPQGISQCGSTGGQLGAGGISNAVVVEFDTYDNDFPGHVFDMSSDHTAIEIDGDMNGPGAPLCGPVQADPLDALLADGLMHTLRVTWNPATTTFCVYVDGSLRITCVYDFITNVFGGNPNVWWGFTGSTGLFANQQYFCPVTIPVPVELMNFTLECSSEKPLLTWYTASESNSNYFTIERSDDGLNYESIGVVAASGNSNNTVMYQFLDERPLGANAFYRLKQTDIDGSTSELGNQVSMCSDIAGFLNIKDVQISEGNLLTVIFETSISGVHQVQLIDISGRVLHSSLISCEKGLNVVRIDNGFQAGMYLIYIANSKESKIRKFNL